MRFISYDRSGARRTRNINDDDNVFSFSIVHRNDQHCRSIHHLEICVLVYVLMKHCSFLANLLYCLPFALVFSAGFCFFLVVGTQWLMVNEVKRGNQIRYNVLPPNKHWQNDKTDFFYCCCCCSNEPRIDWEDCVQVFSLLQIENQSWN